MADPDTDDFLDVPAAAPVNGGPTYGEPALTDPSATRRRTPAGVATAGWLLAGVVAGGAAVAVWHSNSTADAAGRPAAAVNGLPGVGQNGVPQQGVAPGDAAGGVAPGGFGGGRLDGEQHISGTLTSVTASSITVTTASGTSTYPIEATTALVKDGRRVSSTSQLGIGDTVVVHVYPQNGSQHVEVVIDGAPDGFGGPGDDDTTSGQTTTT